MESVFRFMLARPAIPVDNAGRVPIERPSPFQVELIRAHAGVNARANMLAIANRYAATLGIARESSSLALGKEWLDFQAFLQKTPPPTLAQVTTEIKSLFGKGPDALVLDQRFVADDVRAADGVVAVRMLAAEQPAGYGIMPIVLRLAELVRAIIRKDSVGDLRLVLGWVLVLPDQIFPLPNPDREAPPPPPPAPDLSIAEIGTLHTRIEATKTALEELMNMDAITSTTEDAIHPPAQLSRITSETHAASRGASMMSEGPTATRTAGAFALAPQAIESLTAPTQAVIREHGLDASALSLDRLANRLSRRLNTDARRLAQIAASSPLHIRLVGNKAIPVALPPYVSSGLPNGSGGASPGAPSPADPPTSHGTIKSVGMAELLVVKQQLKRYEAIDIGHIENVLQGESMDRQHVNSTVTEQFTLSETETTTTTQQDLESTDRFEMGREVNETVSQNASLSAGLTVSGSYGPTVSFSANMEGSFQTAHQAATTQSTKYGRDVTTRTAKSVSERVLQQKSLRITTTVSDTTDHKIDNGKGNGNVVGVYQWVDKIYEAQVFNYGMRTLFDFLVPEPAAFTIAAMKSRYSDATELRKPADFNITAAMIDEINYPTFALEWNASGVNPPPEPFVTVAKTFHGGPDSGESPTKGSFDDTAELAMPDGYEAVYSTASALFTLWENNASIDMAIGNAVHRFSSGGNWTWSAAMGAELAQLSLAIATFRTATYSVAIDVKCQRTDRAMNKWRNETYNTLLQAYQSQRAAYEDKLAQLQVRAGVEISGRNPAENRRIERTELKRACIAILTAQNFEVFGSIAWDSDGLPNIDFDKADREDPYIRFFEQAFEWENVQYIFYPYFWAKHESWFERFNYDDVDSLFSQFLRAGSARVVVPVRPGFELAIDHFLSTGQTWNGRDLPTIGSSLYVPIIDELREALDAPGKEIPQGEPWEVRVATNLVMLRSDGKLPSWTKKADGTWKPN
jgi:hypothetical protein